jgi:hypothetical protein
MKNSGKLRIGDDWNAIFHFNGSSSKEKGTWKMKTPKSLRFMRRPNRV